ncbi:hypothetical protein YTPLAS18_35970 [Nitrospira sp.]|nr:hypothetical protein YTPLAS18_35970 [Nitrospira sp.]
MSFYDHMRASVLQHGAINNSYLTRFRSGSLTDSELREFAIEFYSFTRFFPRILVAQLVNTEDEAVAAELTKVLYSELGDGHVTRRHELLYRDFLRSIEISVHEAMTRPMRPSTRVYIEGMEHLYGGGNHAMAVGASFGLENMAITMWDHLIPGLRSLRARRFPTMDMTYFTFHRELEQGHEEAMKNAVHAMHGEPGTEGLSFQDKQDFERGMVAVLNDLERFWMGLEPNSSRVDRAQKVWLSSAP